MTDTLIKLIGTDGEVKKITCVGKPVLKQLQKLVGGFIEVVRVPGASMILVVNEEGLLHQMPLNEKASALAQQPIVGPALLMMDGDLD